MDSLIALVIATSILVIIPGPNVALIVANSLKHGLRMGVMTVLGTTAGVALQLVVVVGGLAAVVGLVADALNWIRWAGAAYLIWLGVRTWREPVADLGRVVAAPTIFFRACLLSAINPKTLVFNAAFIPQFVGDGSASQFAMVGAVFLGVIFVGDVLWAYFASSARVFLSGFSHLRNRVTGAFLLVAGIGLAVSRRS